MSGSRYHSVECGTCRFRYHSRGTLRPPRSLPACGVAPVGLTDYAQVEMLGLRCEFDNFSGEAPGLTQLEPSTLHPALKTLNGAPARASQQPFRAALVAQALARRAASLGRGACSAWRSGAGAPFGFRPRGLTSKSPNTLHPTPYTWHPTPCTLHPEPYRLHLTP